MLSEKITSESKAALIQFLRKHEEYALFLLSNLETYGMTLSDALYSGNYKILHEAGKITAAFCLTKKGTLLVQSEELNANVFDAIILACSEENVPISGVLGEWTFASSFWGYLKQKKLIQKEIYTSKEVLYAVDVAKTAYSQDPDVRFLKLADFETWVELRNAYVQEMGFPANTQKEIEKEFLQRTSQQVVWGLFFKEKLVAIADLNARFSDLGQLGGVYTIPHFRKQGFSTRLIRHITHDVKVLHHLRKLIIFTGETNLAARRVYESLGISSFGHYALLF